jgi:hypothetical protein
MGDIKLDFNPASKKATFTFKNGRTLVVGNMTEAKAQAFLERDAPEFARRDCRMHSVGGQLTREVAHDG